MVKPSKSRPRVTSINIQLEKFTATAILLSTNFRQQLKWTTLLFCSSPFKPFNRSLEYAATTIQLLLTVFTFVFKFEYRVVIFLNHNVFSCVIVINYLVY